MSSDNSMPGSGLISPRLDVEDEVRKPRMYRVILYNDDYTTMDFVVDVLVKVFQKSVQEANRIMLDVHRIGQGICGVYTHDVAHTKAREVRNRARDHEFPLRCTCEPT